MDVVVFGTLAVLAIVFGGVSMHLAESNKTKYAGGTTGILSLAWGGFVSPHTWMTCTDAQLLVVALFEGIYTWACYKDSGWRRRFATSAEEQEALLAKRARKQDVELAGARAKRLSGSGRSSVSYKHEHEGAPTLPYEPASERA